MEDKLIIFKTFNNPIYANIAKGLLESNGIYAVLYDENTIYTIPVYTTVIGGVKLMIKESDYSKAIELFGESDITTEKEDAQVICPKCNSTNIVEKFKNNWAAFLIMLISFASSPNSGYVKKYICGDCNHNWKYSDK